MDVPVHGKIWHIPRPSLWWKSRHQEERSGDAEGGAAGLGWARSGGEHSVAGGHLRPGYAASNASTSSSSTTTPVGSLHSPLVRDGHARPMWIPTALPPLEIDGELKKPADPPSGAEPLSAASLGEEGLRREGKGDEDAVSIASSTHFTVVGVGGYGGGRGVRGGARGLKAGKITALVLSMSLLILIGILAAILFLEVRARNMHWPKFT